MPKTLLAMFSVALLGGCVATVRPSPGGPPPPEPPREHHHDRDHDRPPPPPPPRQERIIEGTERAAITHQPIDRAAVDVTTPGMRGEMTVNTGPDGRFRTGEIPRGTFGIRFRREGYEVVNQSAEMRDGVARVDVELRPLRR